MPTLKPPKSPKESSVGKETKAFSRSSKPLNYESSFEANEAQFWAEVKEKSESLIANLIESILPISAVPEMFKLEKDVDYRVLLRDDLPNSYQDNEEYLEKITNQSWNEEDVEFVAEELVCSYFEIVAKALIDRLSNYQGFEATNLSSLKE